MKKEKKEIKNINKPKTNDLIIIGAGPAGLTASIYASRYGLKNLVIGKLIGGLMGEAHKIGNFPSEKEIIGIELVKKFRNSVQNLGTEIISDKVIAIKKDKDSFLIITKTDRKLKSKAVLLAIGTKRKVLNVAGEKEFLGKGVSYCAACDGAFFKNKTVVIVGGGNAGVTAAIYLSDLAKKVYLIEIMKNLLAEKIWLEKVRKISNVEIILENEIKEIQGTNFVEKVILKKEYQGSKELETEGVFVEIGGFPQSELVDKLGLKKDKWGYIQIKNDCSTNLQGIWAAGDMTNGSNYFQQIITACGEGAIAADAIYKYLKK